MKRNTRNGQFTVSIDATIGVFVVLDIIGELWTAINPCHNCIFRGLLTFKWPLCDEESIFLIELN